MLATEKWARNKPPIIALLAPQIATSLRDMHQGFQQIQARRIFNYQAPLPHLPSWFALYRSHRKPLAFLRSLLVDFSAFGQEAVELAELTLEGARLLKRSKNNLQNIKPSLEDVKHIQHLFNETLKASFQDIRDEFSEVPVDEDLRADFMRLFSRMELECSFFMLAHAPCWLLYRAHPSRLYRQARLGDTDAMEKLLRLDALMLHDPAIGKRIQELRFNNKKTRYQTILEAPLKKPKARITRKKLKYSIAGFISAFASVLRKPLTEPEIRALFDAVARDAHSSPIDTDLPDSPEAFAKAINRERKVWLQVFNPDKKM